MQTPFVIRANTQDMMCVEEVFVQNEYRLPDQFLPGDTIIDIGANIGAFALACLTRLCDRVICFEPEEANRRLLAKNTESFRFRVQIEPKAVWAHGEGVMLEDFGSYTAMHRVNAKGTKKVDSVSFAKVLKQYPKVRLLKIDAEGAEKACFDSVDNMDGVQEVCGEIHYHLDLGHGCPTDAWLTNLLTTFGFNKIEIVVNKNYAGIADFFAKR